MALALALAAALLDPALARAGELNGQADIIWAHDRVGQASNQYLRQGYYLDYQRQVTQPIGYRLSLRLQDDRGTSDLGGQETRLQARGWEPSAALSWRLPAFALGVSYRRSQKTFHNGPAPSVTNVIERLSTSAWVMPFTDGSVTLAADRLSYSAPFNETVDDRLSLNFRYAAGPLSLANENRLQHYQDALTGLYRTSMGPRLAVTLSGGGSDRFAASGLYVVDYFRTQQEVRGTEATSVATEVQPSMGLYLNDDLPIDTPPMTATPALVDRTFDVSAGISLGPDGSSFQNLGLDLGRSVGLDELRVHVRDALGIPVPFGGPIDWTIYWSLDGLRWTQVPAVTAAFDVGMSAWRLGFTPTSARYFKAVTFGVNTVDTRVTELQAYLHETFTPNRSLASSTVRQTLGLNLVARPWPLLQVGYAGLLDATAVTPPGSSERWSSDLTNSLDLTAGPLRHLLFGLSLAQFSARQPFGQSQLTVGAAGTVKYRPIERLDAGLEVRRSEDWIDSTISVHTVTTGASVRGNLGVFDSLSGFVDAGLNLQDITGGGSTQYLTTAARISTRLSRSLDLDLDANAQRVLTRIGDTSAQAEVPSINILSYQRLVVEARYHPSTQLTLVVDAGWLVSEGRGGPIRNVRGNWSPFAGGALQLTLDYVQDVDPLTGTSLRRLVVAPLWNMNRHATLGLSYNLVDGSTQGPQESLYLTFTLRS